MEAFKIFYTVLGGLGIFFYGMKAMSDALQAAAGDMIKNIINSLTTNRIFAVTVGIVVTMLVQSSSVTTVMVIGFVNAGLMQLTQAIGVIFGANIGTTVTGWIISIKVGKYGLLLIGLGIFPTLFAKNNNWKHFGRILFGIGMIFFGLDLMGSAFKPLRTMPEFLDAISYFSEQHFTSYLASALVGCILTMIIQSSSAMLGITIAMAMSGVLSFHTAVALVLGQNIGTTITAVLASVGGNVHAKRAAKAHAIFNVLGVVIMLIIFPFYIEFIEWLIPGGANFVNASGDKPYIAVHIATSHTIFNVASTLIFIPFLGHLADFVTRLTPDKEVKEKHHLIVLGNPTDIIPATALVQAEQEVQKFKEIVGKMFDLTRDYLIAEENDTDLLAKITDYEQITDNIQKEITVFVCKVMENPLSAEQSTEAQNMVRISDELESVADYLERVAKYCTRFRTETSLTGDVKTEFFEFFDDVHKFFNSTVRVIEDINLYDKTVSERKSEKLRLIANSMRDKHVDRVTSGEFNPLTALTYSDMVVAVRKIRAHSLNISQAICRKVDCKEN